MCVLHLILRVTQFVMHGEKVIEINLSTHLDAEIFAVIEVPSRWMTRNFSLGIARFFQHGNIEKHVGNGFEPHGHEKVIPHFEHSPNSVILLDHGLR